MKQNRPILFESSELFSHEIPSMSVKVDKREFDALMAKLIATPAMPMASIPRKRKPKTARPKSQSRKVSRSTPST